MSGRIQARDNRTAIEIIERLCERVGEWARGQPPGAPYLGRILFFLRLRARLVSPLRVVPHRQVRCDVAEAFDVVPSGLEFPTAFRTYFQLGAVAKPLP